VLTKFGDCESKVLIERGWIQLNVIAACSFGQRAEPLIRSIPPNKVQWNLWVANVNLWRCGNGGQIVEQEPFIFVQRLS